MYTRKQYLNKECTHREYWGQFVNSHTKNLVRTHIGFSKIMQSDDPHFNDIPLEKWDAITLGHYSRAILRKVDGCVSIANQVCTLKESARQIVEQAVKIKA